MERVGTGRLWLDGAAVAQPQKKEEVMKMQKTMKKQIDIAFVYHAPKGDQPQRYENIRASAKALACLFEAQCPDSREKSLALTKLEEAVMWANAAIARNE